MPENQREHIRLNLNCRVFLEFDEAVEPPAKQGEVVLCETLDISYGGLKVGLDRQLIVGAIIPIGVEISWAETTMHLVGEVRWCRRNPGPGKAWSAGLQVLNAADTDIADWRELLLHV
jgi:hypothetical protein